MFPPTCRKRAGLALAVAASLCVVLGCFLPPPPAPPPGDQQGQAVPGDTGQSPPAGADDSSAGAGSGQTGSQSDSGGGRFGPPPPGDGGDEGSAGGDDSGGDNAPPPVAPRIGEIPDQVISAGEPYTGPTPKLLQGTPPITWSLEVGPAEMTISASTGVVSWANPLAGDYAVVIAASGPGGADTEGWALVVQAGQADEFFVSLVSVGLGGQPADHESQSASVSADGNYVAFSSQASNLVGDDRNDQRDVFLRDRGSGTTTRLSVGYDGTEADGASLKPAVSADGAFVAFQSSAANLVAGDSNAVSDIFVWERWTGRLRRVSVSTAGEQADGASENAAISEEGRYIVFQSTAANLVADDSNGVRDIFLRDRVSRQTRRVSVSSAGAQADGPSFDPAISLDGRFVVFASRASNLVPGDTNGAADIFLYDRDPDENGSFDEGNALVERVSRAAGGFQTNGDSSRPQIGGPAGEFVVFESQATNIYGGDGNGTSDVFMFVRSSGAIVPVSLAPSGETGNDASEAPRVSADGRYVVFQSLASNLVGGDSNQANDVFRRDIWTGTTTLWSADRHGVQGNAGSLDPALTPDGRLLVFESKATNLTDGAVSEFSDIFIRGPLE